MLKKVNKLVFSGADNKTLTDLAIRVGRLQGLIFGLVVSGFAEGEFIINTAIESIDLIDDCITSNTLFDIFGNLISMFK